MTGEIEPGGYDRTDAREAAGTLRQLGTPAGQSVRAARLPSQLSGHGSPSP